MRWGGGDVGGTHIDLVLVDDERSEIAVHKVPTPARDPSVGAIEGLLELCRQSGVAPGARAAPPLARHRAAREPRRRGRRPPARAPPPPPPPPPPGRAGGGGGRGRGAGRRPPGAT